MDSNLNYSDHISTICNKLSKTSGIIFSIPKFVPKTVLIKIYYSLVYPYLISGVLIWGGTANVHLHPLTVLQKNILRTITSFEFLAHTPPLFQETKILPIREIYEYLLDIHMFKLHSSNLLSYPDQSYNTRARNLAVPTFQRLTNTQKSVNFRGPLLWNSIPLIIRN